MLLQIPDVLTRRAGGATRAGLLDAADWVDGRVTAGHQSAPRQGQPAAARRLIRRRAQLGDMILAALQRNPLFISAALPLRVFPPLFNRYQGGQSFGTHVDNAIRQVTGTPHRDPHRSLGHALPRRARRVRRRRAVVEDTYGVHAVKLPAGTWCSIPRPACTTSGR